MAAAKDSHVESSRSSQIGTLAKHAVDPQGSLDKWSDRLVDGLILAAMKEAPIQYPDLENATIGTVGHLTTQPCTKGRHLAGVRPYRLFTGGVSGPLWVGCRPELPHYAHEHSSLGSGTWVARQRRGGGEESKKGGTVFDFFFGSEGAKRVSDREINEIRKNLLLAILGIALIGVAFIQYLVWTRTGFPWDG